MSTLRARVHRALEAVRGFRFLVFLGGGVFLATLGLAVFLVYQNAEVMLQQIRDDFNQQQLALARQAAYQVDADLQGLELAVSSLARNLRRPDVTIEDGGLRAFFEWAHPKGVLAISVVTADQSCPTGGSGTPVLGPLQVEERRATSTTLESVFCAAGPRPGAGALRVRLDVTRLLAGALGPIRSGRTGYAWAIDESGRFLYHPDAEFIGRSAFEARHQREPYISFGEINRIMKEQMLRGQEGVGSYVSGWHRGAYGRIEKLIAFTPVRSKLLAPGQAWSVAVVAPTTEVAEAVKRVYPRQLAAEAALLVGMLVFALLGITYQRRLSRALVRQMGQQEEYMTSILQSSVDAILFVDNDNRVRVWNHGAELIFGYKAAEMVGQTFHRLIPPELDADHELHRIQEEAARKGSIRDYRAQRVTRDGRRIVVDISRTPVRSKEGELIGSTVIIRDVTEKIEWEQRIYHTEKLASIGNLAAGVAHEINNPLAVMLGFTDLLLERAAPGSQDHDDLQAIAECGRNARKIVENLLGFARVTEGLEDTVDVFHCIHVVSAIVKNTLMTGKIELVNEVPEGLPRVCGDPREYQQVVFNLINNAVAAMRDQGSGRLRVSARAEPGWVELSVADSGPGIPPAIRRRVFDPFFTTKKVGEGTGLGLSLCYGIVTKYGGRITFTSQSAEEAKGGATGTTFTVAMPVCDPRPGPADAAPEASQPPQGERP
jgi:two-component system NtrC family sensor kinase